MKYTESIKYLLVSTTSWRRIGDHTRSSWWHRGPPFWMTLASWTSRRPCPGDSSSSTASTPRRSDRPWSHLWVHPLPPPSWYRHVLHLVLRKSHRSHRSSSPFGHAGSNRMSIEMLPSLLSPECYQFVRPPWIWSELHSFSPSQCLMAASWHLVSNLCRSSLLAGLMETSSCSPPAASKNPKMILWSGSPSFSSPSSYHFSAP